MHGNGKNLEFLSFAVSHAVFTPWLLLNATIHARNQFSTLARPHGRDADAGAIQ
jgi:hypothetical protein